jgi:hypothetical protein
MRKIVIYLLLRNNHFQLQGLLIQHCEHVPLYRPQDDLYKMYCEGQFAPAFGHALRARTESSREPQWEHLLFYYFIILFLFLFSKIRLFQH